jgi:GAF domain-containing protein
VPNNRYSPPEPISVLLQNLAATPDEEHTVDSVVQLAVQTIPACDWASITVRRGKNLTTPAATDDVVCKVDQVQFDLWQGPGIDAIWVDDSYRIDDMVAETRWPEWAAAASELGIGSTLSMRLSTSQEVVGALNLYSSQPRAFDDDDAHIAHVYADHAAVALAVSHQFTTLSSALRTRHQIGGAQGVLRCRHGLTMDQAFQVLVRLSRDNNVKLRDLATMVIDANGVPYQFTQDPGAGS